MGGSFNDGKGEPAQIELGQPRLRAGALPNVTDSQHETDGMSRRRSARRPTDGRLLTAQQAKALADRVLAMVATSTRPA